MAFAHERPLSLSLSLSHLYTLSNYFQLGRHDVDLFTPMTSNSGHVFPLFDTHITFTLLVGNKIRIQIVI